MSRTIAITLLTSLLAAPVASAETVLVTLTRDPLEWRDLLEICVDDSVCYNDFPVTVEWEVGSAHKLSAYGGSWAYLDFGWAFNPRWSDGGDVEHVVVAPVEPTTFTVTYDVIWTVDVQEPYWNGDGDVVLPPGVSSPLGWGNWYPDGSAIEVEAIPDVGWRLDRWWVYDGDSTWAALENPLPLAMDQGYAITPEFARETWTLETIARGLGTISPATGPHPGADTVWVEATPEPGYRFVEWIGTGEGSYSGSENPVPVHVNEEVVRQVAVFEPAYYEIALSLSDSDPDVHRGGPLGVAPVYLWLVCGTGGNPFDRVAIQVAGSLPPLAFIPEPGVVATGLSSLDLATTGPRSGPMLLGRFLIGTPGEGTLCLDEFAAGVAARVWDLNGVPFDWPHHVRFTGISTDGSTPCRSGHGCGDAPDGGIGSEPTDAPATTPGFVGLQRIQPNPFRHTTTIDFGTAPGASARLSVYDISGRLVRTLSSGAADERSTVTWDGRDAMGRSTAAGVYFVRLETDRRVETRKIVRVVR